LPIKLNVFVFFIHYFRTSATTLTGAASAWYLIGYFDSGIDLICRYFRRNKAYRHFL
jgi:hypothetical protein